MIFWLILLLVTGLLAFNHYDPKTWRENKEWRKKG